MTLLQVTALSKDFAGLHALEGVSFSAEAGKILGIIGPNGAGKTTLFNILSGIYPPSAGRILFRGKNILRTKPHRISHLGIGRTFQIVRPLNNLDVETNVLVAYGHRIYPSLLKSVFRDKTSRPWLPMIGRAWESAWCPKAAGFSGTSR